MRHRLRAAGYLLVFFAAMLGAAGCTVQGEPATPLDRVKFATDTLDGATKTLTQLNQAGFIPKDVKPKVSSALHAADAALVTYRQHASDPVEADRDAAAFWSAFSSVEQQVVAGLQRKGTVKP